MQVLDIQKNVISYAILSNNFEERRNINESLLPLIEHVLVAIEKDYIKEIDIADEYEHIYGYRIHSAILEQLIKILVKQKKITRLKREFLEINKSMLDELDHSNLYNINLNRLIGMLNFHLRKNGIELANEDIVKWTFDFLRRNALEFNSFVQFKSDLNIDDLEYQNPIKDELVDFLIEERQKDTDTYKFILEIYYGIVLSMIIVAGEDESEKFQEKINIENALLDSNYLFRLLNLQTELEYNAANDTFLSLKNMGCKLWVSSYTIKQMVETLEGIIDKFSESANRVLQLHGDDKFTGLASACIRRSLTRTKLSEIVDELEYRLTNEYEIDIIEEYGFDDIVNKDEREVSLMREKPDASSFGILHDLLLIDIVNIKRPKAIYKYNRAKWWVLTDDNVLTRWNVSCCSKSDIPSCITESQLATVLWLNNPEKTNGSGLYNTAVALRNRRLIDNKGYAALAKEIDRQRDRYSENPDKLSKLTYVFSRGLLDFGDILASNDEKNDTIFDGLIDKVVADKEEIQKQINEQERIINEHKDYNRKLSCEINATKSKLNFEVVAHIKTKSKLCDEKIRKINSNNEIVRKAKKTICRWLFGVKISLCVLGFLCSIFILLYINNMYDEFFAKNYNLVTCISNLVLITLSVLGAKKILLNKIVDKSAQFILKYFVCNIFIHVSKCYDCIDELNVENQELQKEITMLQKEIDGKLV